MNRPASGLGSGYHTRHPEEKYAIRQILGEAHDTPGNRDRLSDLSDNASADEMVREIVRAGGSLLLTLELEDGTRLLFPSKRFAEECARFEKISKAGAAKARADKKRGR